MGIYDLLTKFNPMNPVGYTMNALDSLGVIGRSPGQDPKRQRMAMNGEPAYNYYPEPPQQTPPNQMDMSDMNSILKLFYALLGYQDTP